MKTLMTCLALAALAMAPLTHGEGDDFPKGSPKFEHSLESVLKSSKENDKPIVVVFSAIWCSPCLMLKKQVFPSEAVKPFHDKFNWAYIDYDEPENQKAKVKYGVSVIPHIVFADKDGEQVDELLGPCSAEDFAKLLQGALEKVNSAGSSSSTATTTTTAKK